MCVSTGKVEQREEGNAIKEREERGERKRKKLSGHGAGLFFFPFFFPHKGFRTFSSIINALLLKFKWASETPEILEMCGQK